MIENDKVKLNQSQRLSWTLITNRYRYPTTEFNGWEHVLGWKDCLQHDPEVQKIKAENEKLRKGLQFYADITSWEAREITNDHWEEWSEDDDNNDIFIGGKLARQILKEIE